MSALLIRAGATKIAGPAAAAGALGEVLAGGRPVPIALVRAAAAVEVASGLAVSLPALRLPDQVVAGLLGGSFFALGALGRLRGSRRPCGCLGGDGTSPLGAKNMLAGLALLAVVAVNLTTTPSDVDDVAAGAALGSALVSVGWLWWTYREQIRVVVGNLGRRAGSSA
jgi:hypothetical protein